MQHQILNIIRWELRTLPIFIFLILFTPQILPAAWLGKSYSPSLVFFFQIAIGLGSLVGAWRLSQTRIQKQSQQRVWTLSAAGYVLVCIASLFRTSPIISNIECPKGPLSEVSHCEGSTSWFKYMNSGHYAYVSAGIPQVEFCAATGDPLGSVTNVNFRGFEAEKQFKKIRCESYVDTPANCYISEFESIGWNTHFYRMVLLSPNCKNALYFTGSSRPPEQNLRLIRKFSATLQSP